MSGEKSWKGEKELQSLLQELCGHPNAIPPSKIKQMVTVCNKYVTDYKLVVYEIEKFMKKSPDKDKIGGLFILDCLCRQHSKERETFAKRFAIRLKETLSFLHKVPSKDKTTVLRFLEEWQKKAVFPPDILQSIVVEWGGTSATATATSSSSSSNKHHHQRVKESKPATTAHDAHDVQPSQSQQQRAHQSQQQPAVASDVISSVINDLGGGYVDYSSGATEETCTSQPPPQAQPQVQEVKKAVKLCPFRDGNCPFGDKCRYSHFESNTLEQYAARLLAKSNNSSNTSNHEHLVNVSVTSSKDLHYKIQEVLSGDLLAHQQVQLLASNLPLGQLFDPKVIENTINPLLQIQTGHNTKQSLFEAVLMQSVLKKRQAEQIEQEEAQQTNKKKMMFQRKIAKFTHIPCPILPSEPQFFTLSTQQFNQLFLTNPMLKNEKK